MCRHNDIQRCGKRRLRASGECCPESIGLNQETYQTRAATQNIYGWARGENIVTLKVIESISA